MIKARPKYPTDLYSTIYIDNIKKAVVICLIIPTTFPFDSRSRVDNVRHTSWYFFMHSSIKRKYCRNDQTNDNSYLNIIDVNSTIQVRTVLWFGFYHTDSLLKQYKNELYLKKIPRCMTYVVHPVFEHCKKSYDSLIGNKKITSYNTSKILNRIQ